MLPPRRRLLPLPLRLLSLQQPMLLRRAASSTTPPGLTIAKAAAPSMTAKWKTPPMPTEGVDAAFGSVWASALDADVRGRYATALTEARTAIEVASGSGAGPGRDQALRLSHHLAGVSLLRLGRLPEAVRSLDTAREVAVRVSSQGHGDDAYTDVGGVLIDTGVALAMHGDWDGAQKHLSRALYMAERAYRPDDDLVATACSNLAEVLALRGGHDQAVELAERAVRLTDKMERFAMIQKQTDDEKEEEEEGAARQQRVGGGGGGGEPGVAAGSSTGEGKGSPSEAIWAVPAEILALNARGIMRRLNFGRLLSRVPGRTKEEGLFYVFQALQDSRKTGLRGNAVLYSQCLAAAGAAHLSSLLAEGATIRTSHLTGCTEDNEVTWAPEALMQKALAVLGPVLGERHPETRACHGNLALLLPLQSGVAALQDALAPEGSKGDSSSSSSRSSSSLHAGLRDNHKALGALLEGLVDARDAQSKCAAELTPGGGGVPPVRVLWAINGVLGVGLRSWPAAAAEGKATM